MWYGKEETQNGKEETQNETTFRTFHFTACDFVTPVLNQQVQRSFFVPESL